uniref:Tetraspanin n=1 Tax=Oreochromis niloticus TaxID=8128 RepID=A0A669BVT5_ORENI
MGKGCVAVTKYFLFLFNLLFFVFGALILGFGLWVLLDNKSFIAVLQGPAAPNNPNSYSPSPAVLKGTMSFPSLNGKFHGNHRKESSDTVKVASYILIGVGSLTMAMGFFGCIGSIYEVRCLLGLYFTCLLLILVAQITAGVLIYFQRDRLAYEMDSIIKTVIITYPNNRTTEHPLDYIQRTMKCCGFTGPGNWSENPVIKNSTKVQYSCSCRNTSLPGEVELAGLCTTLSPDPPVYETGCKTTIETWLKDNLGVILGICAAVAVVELLGMILSMCLCKNVGQEDYSKVPKY